MTRLGVAAVAAVLALMTGCAAIDQGAQFKRDTVKGVMDSACKQSLDTRKAEYRAFGDTRLLPFDCNQDGQPDF